MLFFSLGKKYILACLAVYPAQWMVILADTSDNAWSTFLGNGQNLRQNAFLHMSLKIIDFCVETLLTLNDYNKKI